MSEDGVVSEIFDPERWTPVAGFDFTDITYHRAVDHGTVRIAFGPCDVAEGHRDRGELPVVAADHVGCLLSEPPCVVDLAPQEACICPKEQDR